MVKNTPVNVGDTRNTGSISGLGISPGGGNDTPLQYSSLETPPARRAWWTTVQGATKSQTQLSD